jgi:hypothetical protein
MTKIRQSVQTQSSERLRLAQVQDPERWLECACACEAQGNGSLARYYLAQAEALETQPKES